MLFVMVSSNDGSNWNDELLNPRHPDENAALVEGFRVVGLKPDSFGQASKDEALYAASILARLFIVHRSPQAKRSAVRSILLMEPLTISQGRSFMMLFLTTLES